MQKLQSFNYNGSRVSFMNDNGVVYLNGTDMARPFGKRTNDYLSNQRTKEFLSALAEEQNSVAGISAKGYGPEVNHIVDRLSIDIRLVRVYQRGENHGTWMHEDVALDFAQWLNPKFAVWCNQRIKELLKYGATAMNPEDLLNPDFIINLATELKRERAEKELISRRLEIQGKVIQESAPKVAYYQEVLQSESLIATNVIAKDLGMSAITLNQVLHNRGIIYKSGGVWVLYDKYQNKGYTKTKTTTFTDKLNETKTVIHTYWTEKGREFINSLFKVKATA